MEALEVIFLGQLARIGEAAMRGGGDEGLRTGAALVLRDVFAQPGTSVGEVRGPHRAASGRGRARPERSTPRHTAEVARRGVVSADAALARAFAAQEAASAPRSSTPTTWPAASVPFGGRRRRGRSPPPSHGPARSRGAGRRADGASGAAAPGEVVMHAGPLAMFWLRLNLWLRIGVCAGALARRAPAFRRACRRRGGGTPPLPGGCRAGGHPRGAVAAPPAASGRWTLDGRPRPAL
jgi:hypothetical protein